MGKPLTERQKADRAAKAVVRKQRAELGPLFADQAEAPDVEVLMLQRRMGWSVMQQHLAELLGNIYLGDAITEQALRRLAREHLASWFDGLDSYRKGTYPSTPLFGILFWAKRLTTTERVVFGWRRVEDPTAPYIGLRLVEDGAFPPADWLPPLTRADLPTTPPRCPNCRYYHEPEQQCIELNLVGDSMVE